MIIPMHVANADRALIMIIFLNKLGIGKVSITSMHLSYMGRPYETYLKLPINLDITGPNCWKVEY